MNYGNPSHLQSTPENGKCCCEHVDELLICVQLDVCRSLLSEITLRAIYKFFGPSVAALVKPKCIALVLARTFQYFYSLFVSSVDCVLMLCHSIFSVPAVVAVL